ncbi:nucleotide exchange factor GrpE [archaeon CG_4_10_14_0_2_um_filter_Archaea_38_6]|nr:MAG: nucleotide exchange factor GrpE [archaeon CG07_land_8_20_14_0_80_38_8]PIU88320.1 MAG: nucleotide exchange factor GrpE [archaeon CG06_land_8_20_14_3_00_37_11]PJA22082.1 MAG: nucleotide exchange factor GrpE [archaeon CG_4_10_14_0_2_um_filter_Archaea_38_6]
MPKIKKHKKDDEAVINQLKRLQADFDNYKKRVIKEKEIVAGNACAELVKKLLPVIDSFDKAMPLITDEGVKLIRKNLMKTLKDEGLEEIKSKDEKFDTFLHEAVMTVNSKEAEDNVVVEEAEKGYKFGGKVIRPAKVIVNKKP